MMTAKVGVAIRPMSDSTSRFDIPARPERRYRSGGVSHEGGTAFYLIPEPSLSVEELDEHLSGVLGGTRYVKGDWFDFPMPVYLVHDREVSTAFRTVVREGRIELHVLPKTDSTGLEALFRALCDRTAVEWTVECHTEKP